MRDLMLNKLQPKLQLKLHLEAHDWLLAEEAYAQIFHETLWESALGLP
jgi:hypothetical protein